MYNKINLPCEGSFNVWQGVNMEERKRCCFAGHSDFTYNEDLRGKIKSIAENLILNNNVKEFWVGHYGRFDSCCSSVIRELQQTYKEIRLDLVIPYITKGINEYKELYYKDYDNIFIADIPLTTPKRLQIIKGNEYIVDNCEYIICFIERNYGGAHRTFTYASRKKKEIFNVAKIQGE